MYQKGLESSEATKDPLICGMLCTMDKLEQELSALRGEQDRFQAFAEAARFLSMDTKTAVIRAYDRKIKYRMDELAAIKSHLAELGYVA